MRRRTEDARSRVKTSTAWLVAMASSVIKVRIRFVGRRVKVRTMARTEGSSMALDESSED